MVMFVDGGVEAAQAQAECGAVVMTVALLGFVAFLLLDAALRAWRDRKR
jgi:hypothetical protein